MAFFPGSVGVIYRQSPPRVAAMGLSVLWPSSSRRRCAPPAQAGPRREEDRLLGWFNRSYTAPARLRARGRFCEARVRALIGTRARRRAGVLSRAAQGFLPEEDRASSPPGALPPGATQEQRRAGWSGSPTTSSTRRGAVTRSSASSLRFAGRGQNSGLAFVKLKDWDVRDKPSCAPRRGASCRQGALADQGGEGLRLRAAGDQRARQRRRLPIQIVDRVGLGRGAAAARTR